MYQSHPEKKKKKTPERTLPWKSPHFLPPEFLTQGLEAPSEKSHLAQPLDGPIVDEGHG